MSTRKPTFVSLFSGCGGFDLGFTQSGFRTLGAFDACPSTVDVYRTNLGSRVQVADLSVGLPLDPASVTCDVVIAGPPCQGFSTAGKRRLGDSRNHLLVTAAELAVLLNPKVILIENVAGAVAGQHRKYWDKAAAIIRGAKYKTCEFKCNASSLGVAQIRRRVMLIGWKTSFNGDIDLPTTPGGCLRDSLKGINGAANNERSLLSPESKAGQIARHIKPHHKLSNVRSSSRSVHTWQIPEVFGRTNSWERCVLESLMRRRRQNRVRSFGDADPVSAQALRHFVGAPVAETLRRLIKKGFVRRVNGAYDLTHTFNGKFHRLSWDAPAPTVDTKFGDPYYFLHPTQDRAFTVREAARIQGFPDSFVFHGTHRMQFQMVGNAVPPPLARTLADYIRTFILV